MGTETSSIPSFASVTTYLSWDHDRLDMLLESVRGHVVAGRPAAAREAYRRFEQGLDRHIRIEEELLFPVFEARSGIVGGPTAVMREEHRSIRVALDMMRQGLERDDAAGFQAGVRFLESVLPEHNAKEEHVLYPTTDRMLTDPERAAFTERLRRE